MTPKLKEKISAKTIVVFLIVAIILIYSSLKFKDLISGPEIVLYSPNDGSSLEDELINIKGRADRITKIYLNGRKIFTDQNGNFEESLLLSNGYNFFELKAEDKFGREIVKKLQLVYDKS
ncbi:MAG: hypothetical protein WCX70_00205 [Candidatus Paceibacterota bacterium]|jgi:hypothetical protein